MPTSSAEWALEALQHPFERAACMLACMRRKGPLEDPTHRSIHLHLDVCMHALIHACGLRGPPGHHKPYSHTVACMHA